jgi:hypothetical protein
MNTSTMANMDVKRSSQDKESAMTNLNREFEWYRANQDSLVARYNGRVLVIRELAVVGDYSDEATAVADARKKFPAGTFLIQKCSPGDTEYTSSFSSRVILSK